MYTLEPTDNKSTAVSGANNALCCYREYLEGPKVFKSKGLVFAQFWSKFKNSTSGWSPTVKIFRKKYFRRIFVENMVPVAKKPEGGVRETWNFAHNQITSCQEKNVKITFFSEAPNMVKMQSEN